MESKNKLPLRIGVGIVLLNNKNSIFVGKRIDNAKRIDNEQQANQLKTARAVLHESEKYFTVR